MKIVIAMDAFKGGVTAPEACEAVRDGLLAVDSSIDVVLKPMADGGEGTASALLASRPGGEWVEAMVAGPLPQRQVTAGYAWFGDDRTAVVEMATANGLPLLARGERNPLLTSTLGTGQLIDLAIRKGARKVLLTIGGSATVDGGVGMATALGWQFLDRDGNPVEPVGGALHLIESVIAPTAELPAVEVLCDVTNPLCGDNGAAAVFGPQKGATPKMVRQLDGGLDNLARVVKRDLGLEMREWAGGGAAGGLGAGAVAFLGGSLRPGIEAILEAMAFDGALRGADWCITGEGSFDSQSLQGKVVSGVAAAARRRSVPTVVMAGRVKATAKDYRPYGIVAALPTHGPEVPMDEVLRREAEFIRATASDWLRNVRART